MFTNIIEYFGTSSVSMTLLAGLTAGMFLSSAVAQSNPAPSAPGAQVGTAATAPATPQSPAATASHSRYRPERFSKRALEYYQLVWGVDSMSVKWAESGEMIRFSYRILDTKKSEPLNDKKNEPLLIDPQAGVKLIVPSLEKVGKLRQSSPPEAGKVYWMAFSNKGRLVKRGDHVDVVIGKFRAEGLVVD